MTTGLRRWVFVALSALLFLAACTAFPLTTASPTAPATPMPTRSPTETPLPPTPTPTPTPPPESRLELARQAYAFGDWARAGQLYRSLLDEETPLAEEGYLGLGKTLIAQGRTGEGIENLNLLLALNPTSPLTTEVHVRLGDAFLQIGDGAEAAKHYELVLRGPQGGLLAPYANEWLGDAFYASGAFPQALGAYLAAVSLTPDNLSRRVFLLEKQAMAASAMLDEREALSAYDAILAEARIPSYRARILYQSAKTAHLFNDTTEYLARLRQLVENYPDQHYGYLALAELLDAGETVDDLLRGKIDYWEGAYSPAVQALYRYLDAHPEHDGEAHYYIARAFFSAGSYDLAIQEAEKLIQTHPADDPWWDDGWIVLAEARAATGDLDGAQAAYRHLAEVMPQSPLAPSALWKAAELDEHRGDLLAAADGFLDLAARYPEDSGAPEACFRAGLDRYRVEALPEAIAAWRELLARYPLSERAQAARFWEGKALLAQGETVSATATFQEAVAMGPWDYYGIRAADLLEGRSPLQVEAVPPLPCEDEVEAVRAWIAGWSGQSEEPWPPAVIADDRHLARGLLLLQLDHFDEGKTELELLRDRTADDPMAQYALALAARDGGLYRTSLLAAATLWRLSPAADLNALPRSVGCLIYPTYYAPLIEAAAEEEGFAPLQLYALIRQESLFEGSATSWASAHGLMQIIPQTGAQIAQALGWPPDYTTEDLYRPVVSIRFGTWYLAQQRDRLDGSLVAAIAAYNGGPANAAHWWELAGGDPDLFVELITLQETRRYVEAITEHLLKYRTLYLPPSP